MRTFDSSNESTAEKGIPHKQLDHSEYNRIHVRCDIVSPEPTMVNTAASATLARARAGFRSAASAVRVYFLGRAEHLAFRWRRFRHRRKRLALCAGLSLGAFSACIAHTFVITDVSLIAFPLDVYWV